MIASQLRWTSKSVDLLWLDISGGSRAGGGDGLSFAYYAGKRRTLKAVASTAHCAIEGYISDMEAYPERLRGVQWLLV